MMQINFVYFRKEKIQLNKVK